MTPTHSHQISATHDQPRVRHYIHQELGIKILDTASLVLCKKTLGKSGTYKSYSHLLLYGQVLFNESIQWYTEHADHKDMVPHL